jgi:hypothetical protein
MARSYYVSMDLSDAPDGPCSYITIGPGGLLERCDQLGRPLIAAHGYESYQLEHWCPDHWPKSAQIGPNE